MTALSRCAAVILLLTASVAAGGSAASTAKVPWTAKPDPSTEPGIYIPGDASGAVPVKSGRLIIASYSSHFAALDPKPSGQKMDGDWFQVYDLLNLKPIGPTFPAPVDFGQGHVLSQDGAFLAARAKGQPGSVNLWDCKTGKLGRVLIASDQPGQFAAAADFLGQNRLLTECYTGPAPGYEEQTLYQVWDLITGKENCHFTIGLVWHPSWATISPGGRYLVVEKTETRSYRLLAWDLATGKEAGEAEFQGPLEPWGQACGMAFSSDGKQLAMIWRLGQKDLFGQMVVFDVAKGRTIARVPLDYTMKSIGLTMQISRNQPSLQWTPGGDAWLLLGHLLVDSKTGAAIGRIGREPNNTWDVKPRVFLGLNSLTYIAEQSHQLQLAFTPVPKRAEAPLPGPSASAADIQNHSQR